MKIYFKKGPRVLFGHFWFLHHSLKWFLVVPPMDTFAFMNNDLIAYEEHSHIQHIGKHGPIPIPNFFTIEYTYQKYQKTL